MVINQEGKEIYFDAAVALMDTGAEASANALCIPG